MSSWKLVKTSEFRTARGDMRDALRAANGLLLVRAAAVPEHYHGESASIKATSVSALKAISRMDRVRRARLQRVVERVIAREFSQGDKFPYNDCNHGSFQWWHRALNWMGLRECQAAVHNIREDGGPSTPRRG